METELTFDKILHSVGDKGRYQKRLICGFYFIYTIVTPWIVLLPIFLMALPDHWCHVDGKPDHLTIEEWKNLTIPWEKKDDKEGYSQCTQYKIDFNSSDFRDQENEIIDCQHGWDYDKTWYDQTLASRNNWVCEEKDRKASWLSVGLSAKIVGIIISNTLSDIYGRKKVCFFLLIMYCVFSLLRLYFSHGWIVYLFAFLCMLPMPALLQVGLVFVTEQIHSGWRPMTNAIFFGFWMIGMCILPLFAWLTRDWIWLTVVTTVPYLFFLFAWPFLEESSRWLASRGRTKDALASLNKIANENGIKPPENLEKTLINFIEEKKKGAKTGNLLDAFRSKPLMKLWVLLTFCWSCNLLVYYALNYSVYNLAGNPFLNFFLIGFVEGPSTLIGWMFCQTIGRRFSQVLFFSFLIVTTACPIFFVVPQGVETIVCVVVSKIVNDASFFAFYLLMVEIYPTSHRTSLMGLSNAIVMALNTSTPYIAHSAVHWSRLPYVIMCSLATLGCFLSFFVPETVGHNLPQTVVDSERQFSNQPLFSYRGRKPNEWVKNLVPSWHTSKKTTKIDCSE